MSSSPASPNILVFAGSARSASLNKQLAAAAARAATAHGASVTLLDLHDLPLPLFDLDLEARDGEPANAKAFKAALKSHHAFIIASPEHNGTYSALLKNALDWASRRQPDEKPLEVFSGKLAAIISASPGALGGLRGLLNLRILLTNLGVTVLPDQLAVGGATEAFDDQGGLKQEAQRNTLDRIVARLVETAAKLHG